MIYLDTSVLGAVFFREAGCGDLVASLERRRKQGLTISAWTLTEMASVGGIKQRTGAIDAGVRRQALANFQRFASAHLGMIEIDPADFRAAAVFIDMPLNLRAGSGRASPAWTGACARRPALLVPSTLRLPEIPGR